MTSTELRPLSFVQRVHFVRPLNAAHVERIKRSMEENGVQPFPLRVTPDGVLFAGAHRHEAMRLLGLGEALIHVETPASLDAAALADNAASEQALPMTFVDFAELIWRKSANGQTLQAVADELGWGKTDVGNYSSLRQIDDDAWRIVSTTLRDAGRPLASDDVDAASTNVDFSEGILRTIIHLDGEQQIELCRNLADGSIDKRRFKLTAGRYRNRNAALEWFAKEAADIGDAALTDDGRKRIERGDFDDEWKDGAGPKLARLVESLHAAWHEKNAIRLICGDFLQSAASLAAGSIDAIITDPPYNISTDRVYRLAAQADWSKNFGDWDRKSEAAFVADLTAWAKEFHRLLRPGGSGFMFVGEAYLNVAQAAFDAAGFDIRGTFYWCRGNPGTSVTKADFMPAMDFAIQFSKPGAPRTFNYPGEPEGFNWRNFPICGGKERLTKEEKVRGKVETVTLHPTQKPERVIEYLMELVTFPGNTVLDGFMGVGTTPAVAKRLKRKCIGIELDKMYFEAAQRRLGG